MYKKTLLLFLFLLFVLFSNKNVSAVHIANNTSYISKNQVVNESVIMKDERITIEGTVNGDVYVTGETVTITGIIQGNVYIIARNIHLGGNVKNNVFVKGDTISFSDIVVGRDVKVLGGEICIGKNTEFKGEVLYWGEKNTTSCREGER